MTSSPETANPDLLTPTDRPTNSEETQRSKEHVEELSGPTSRVQAKGNTRHFFNDKFK